MTYFEFVGQKEHSFLRNIFDPDVISKSEQLKNIKSYYCAFETFIDIVALLENVYTSDSIFTRSERNCLREIFEENDIESFKELCLEISECDVKNVYSLKKTNLHQMKIIVSFLPKSYKTSQRLVES